VSSGADAICNNIKSVFNPRVDSSDVMLGVFDACLACLSKRSLRAICFAEWLRALASWSCFSRLLSCAFGYCITIWIVTGVDDVRWFSIISAALDTCPYRSCESNTQVGRWEMKSREEKQADIDDSSTTLWQPDASTWNFPTISMSPWRSGPYDMQDDASPQFTWYQKWESVR
jgi:hypothetical protein